MCHRAVAWISDVTYACVIGLKTVKAMLQIYDDACLYLEEEELCGHIGHHLGPLLPQSGV